MNLQRDFIGQLTPLRIRKGPTRDRYVTDFTCFIIYIGLLGSVVALMLFSQAGVKLEPQEVRNLLKTTNFGGPLYAITEAIIPIFVSLLLIAIICMILMITSFIFPFLVTYIYLPFMFLFIILGGIIYALRYLGIQLPLIPIDIQNNFAKSKTTFSLIMAIGFFLGFLIILYVLFTKMKKFSYIDPVLRMARVLFWSNTYMLFFSIFFTLISIASLFANAALISISLTRTGTIITPAITSTFIVLQALWTHGFIKSTSDFFFQSIAVHWYFKKRRQFEKQQIICGTLLNTLLLIGKHIGTISFGFIFAYIPELVNNFINKLQKYPRFYCLCCFWQSFTTKLLSKYCYFQTILQGLPFCEANKQMYGLRQRTKKILPNIYMMGNFYITLVKMCCITIAVITCYFLIQHSSLDHFMDDDDILGPLVIVLFSALQIASHFMSITGLVADTLTFCYSVDIQIESRQFGTPEPFNCPYKIRDIIYQVKAGKDYIK